MFNKIKNYFKKLSEKIKKYLKKLQKRRKFKKHEKELKHERKLAKPKLLQNEEFKSVFEQTKKELKEAGRTNNDETFSVAIVAYAFNKIISKIGQGNATTHRSLMSLKVDARFIYPYIRLLSAEHKRMFADIIMVTKELATVKLIDLRYDASYLSDMSKRFPEKKLKKEKSKNNKPKKEKSKLKKALAPLAENKPKPRSRTL